jgi:hypothetical protein
MYDASTTLASSMASSPLLAERQFLAEQHLRDF